MNYLEEFDEEPYTWKDYLYAIIVAPVALPLFMLRKLFVLIKERYF